KQFPIKGMAHITGGGIIENLPRIFPKSVMAKVNSESWRWPPIFKWLQEQANISSQEMYRTFNCGIGMILVVNKNDTQNVIQSLTNLGEKSWELGKIETRKNNLGVDIL